MFEVQDQSDVWFRFWWESLTNLKDSIPSPEPLRSQSIFNYFLKDLSLSTVALVLEVSTEDSCMKWISSLKNNVLLHFKSWEIMKYLISHERHVKFEFQCPVDKNLTWDITEPIIYK